MTTVKFDEVPTQTDSLSLDEVDADDIKRAWDNYEAKPEYKQFNKHDMIEHMLEGQNTSENS